MILEASAASIIRNKFVRDAANVGHRVGPSKGMQVYVSYFYLMTKQSQLSKKSVSLLKRSGTFVLTMVSICLLAHQLLQYVWLTGYIKGFKDWRVVRQRSLYNSGRSGDRIQVETRFSAPVQNRPWISNCTLYNGHRAPFPGAKRPGCCVDHPHPPSAEVKESVELYRYSPSGGCMTFYRVNFNFTSI
jgi:hypothetical protein